MTTNNKYYLFELPKKLKAHKAKLDAITKFLVYAILVVVSTFIAMVFSKTFGFRLTQTKWKRIIVNIRSIEAMERENIYGIIPLEKQYKPVIEYEYGYGEDGYGEGVIEYSHYNWMTMNEAQEVMNKYTLNQQTNAYQNTDDSSDVYLEPQNVNEKTLWVLILEIAFVMGVLWFILI